jgi:hypothetical protein
MMMNTWRTWTVAAVVAWASCGAVCWGQQAVRLPSEVRAVWDLDAAHRDVTATRDRVCINGLWQWQPADPQSDRVPEGDWGYFKVPGAWPGITSYMQKDFQTVHAHPRWKDTRLSGVTAAWYQREITIPAAWEGRRIAVRAEYLNSYAVVYVDGRRAGEMRFPAGEVEIGSLCRPGQSHMLTMLVVALPLQGVRMSYNDSNAAREVRGSVARRGLCGDVFLTATPAAARIGDIRLDTSVRQERLTVDVELSGLAPDTAYSLRVEIKDGQHVVKSFPRPVFTARELDTVRIQVSDAWIPEKLWDTHTPQHQYDLSVSLLDADAKPVDTAWPVRFGFREFWIDGRDFYLNGSRIFLSAVPLDNAQVGAALATYEGARESLLRLQSFGINFVYTHNYDCQPGSHLSFAEILRAADDVGMLVALSQPHFSDYDWQAADAEQTNGYAQHAAFYVSVAQHHPSVVMYATSHNATGYNEDMNPDLIDGIYDQRSSWAMNNVRRALRAEAIVRRLDPSRIVYHHSSGNLSSMHTSNFYPNFVPVQELSDWFEHWATVGVKPFFACEYGAPFTWDWAMYRGWFKGAREFGSAAVPWDFCLAEWNSQFLGDAAFSISDQERRNLRWEAERFRSGRLWHRWDYPHQLGSTDFDERYPVLANYLEQNWRAFRTWGVSAISPWEHNVFWKLRPGMDRNRRMELATDWQRLQRPGFSPDFLEQRYERMDLAYERADWVATPAAEAMYRNNRPLLAYLAGKPDRFTSQDHNFLPGEAVEKQIVAINNSRVPVICRYEWAFRKSGETAALAASDAPAEIRVETGQQARIPLRVALPADLAPGEYVWSMTARMRAADGDAGGVEETQEDRLTIHVLPPSAAVEPGPVLGDSARVALFDPSGETGALLASMGVRCRTIGADANLERYDLLVFGRGALSAEGPAPDLDRVREGLKVLVFEQTREALEKRLGFRAIEYGLRNVFPRVPDHPLLARVDGAAPARLARRGDACAAALGLRAQFPVQRGTVGALVRAGGSAIVAVRQSRQCGFGLDRKARSRRFPADHRRRIQLAVHTAARVSRRPRDGAVLPIGRDGTHRIRTGGRPPGQEPVGLRVVLEACPTPPGFVCGRSAGLGTPAAGWRAAAGFRGRRVDGRGRVDHRARRRRSTGPTRGGRSPLAGTRRPSVGLGTGGIRGQSIPAVEDRDDAPRTHRGVLRSASCWQPDGRDWPGGRPQPRAARPAADHRRCTSSRQWRVGPAGSNERRVLPIGSVPNQSSRWASAFADGKRSGGSSRQAQCPGHDGHSAVGSIRPEGIRRSGRQDVHIGRFRQMRWRSGNIAAGNRTSWAALGPGGPGRRHPGRRRIVEGIAHHVSGGQTFSGRLASLSALRAGRGSLSSRFVSIVRRSLRSGTTGRG